MGIYSRLCDVFAIGQAMNPKGLHSLSLQPVYLQNVLYGYSMTRPPKARDQVLDAAERIVKERGAAKLTYEELVRESGVSRGGITYHFGSKEALLRALVERDLANSCAAEACMRSRIGLDSGAELIALIRMWATPDPERRRFTAGMLSAVAHDPSLLDPIRRHHQQASENRDWTPAAIQRAILRLAAEGLFWSEFFGCGEVPVEHREHLVERMEALARQWSADP